MPNPIVSAVGSIAGGLIGADRQADAAEDAADESSAANRYATDMQREMFDLQREDQAPWRETGTNALNELWSQRGNLTRQFGMSDFQADPGYDWRMQQGNQAIERSAAARGNLLSPATMKALQEYGQGMASQEYGNAYNRFVGNQENAGNFYRSLSGLGLTSAQGLSGAAQNYANNVGNLAMSNAGNQANAGFAQSRAYGSGINQLTGALGQYGGNQGYGPTGALSFNNYMGGFVGGGPGSMTYGGSVQGNPNYEYDL